MSSADGALVVVFEGQRTRVRVFRRFFYPVQARDEDVEVIVYSDTGREREVTYRRADEYGLDNPLRLRVIRREIARINTMLHEEELGKRKLATPEERKIK